MGHRRRWLSWRASSASPEMASIFPSLRGRGGWRRTKVLCVRESEEPLEPVLLQDEDVAACDALVRAVLRHWTALRSSSPEWLREQFFLRDGKLEDVDSGRRLTIERRAQDVLLARLP